jgi:RNA polymerase sigma factor (TIGR02999 family)
MKAPENITMLLQAVEHDPAKANSRLLEAVYGELRKLAAGKMSRELPGQTLQATGLVHEAWLRLVDEEGRAHFQNRAHFFGAAAEAMRRILVDAARRKLAQRRGGRLEHYDLDDVQIAAPSDDDQLLAVHEALDRLAMVSSERADLVKLRYFAGLTIEEAAAALNVTERTAKRWWTFARAWLFQEISRG